jgi:hypothetical protein
VGIHLNQKYLVPSSYLALKPDESSKFKAQSTKLYIVFSGVYVGAASVRPESSVLRFSST